MTKEQYQNYNKDFIYCETCKRFLKTNYFSYSHIRMDGTASKCRYCEWIKVHNGIPKIKEFTDEQVSYAIQFILFEKSIYINDLAKDLGIELNDAIDIVKELHIGNKHYVVKCNCSLCGKEIENPVSVYLKYSNLYCSYNCYWNHKSDTVGHGKDNMFYNRIKTTCTCCGKEIEIVPHKYSKINSFGDNHNFCSKECYWKYRSKYYIGSKAAASNRVFTNEQREKMKMTIIKNSRSAKRFDSKIQLTVNRILDNACIDYKREYIIKYYAVDNFLIDSGLIIEVMGDYWHSSPLRYNEYKYKINETQQRSLQHDKQKHTYIKNHLDIEILYLWEYDIEKYPDMCEELILQYISNNGKLDNYHSFNWRLNNGALTLNNEVIVPYQDMKTESYRYLLKKKVG